MNEASYVVVFPNIFSKNKIPVLISNIKKILKLQKLDFKSVKRDDAVILVEANDPVFASSSINLLFGIEKIAIARQVDNKFENIVSKITSVGGNLLLKGERFLIRVEGTAKGFLTKDVELAATSSIIEKKSKLGAKPGTEQNYDKMLYTYLTKKNAYVCIYIDDGYGGIASTSSKENTLCAVYDEFSAINCLETIKQGFSPKILVCYRSKSELTNLAKLINQIIPRLVEQKISLDFFKINVNSKGSKNYLTYLSTIHEIMINEAKSKKIEHISLAVSPLVFSTKIVDYSLNRIFNAKKIPIMPLFGLDSMVFDDVKNLGMENSLNKINKFFSMRFDEIPKISSKEVSLALNTKKSIVIKIGPNNVHDILDSIDDH